MQKLQIRIKECFGIIPFAYRILGNGVVIGNHQLKDRRKKISKTRKMRLKYIFCV